mmetsp:Transcript_34926/g.96576  ORF Transcript_34926/g.96576 Transcript_34926/m.96576 type:complete len:638 (-) Transcript_34926:138-2051(-)
MTMCSDKGCAPEGLTSPGKKKSLARSGTTSLGGTRSRFPQSSESPPSRAPTKDEVRKQLGRGAELNGLLKSSHKRLDPEALTTLWSEVKVRLMQRYGCMQDLYRALDANGEGSISFIEFNDMLWQIHIQLDQRVCRAVFDHLAAGDRTLSLRVMLAALLERTIRGLGSVLADRFAGKQERVQTHIHTFLQHLAQANPESSARGVDRFQRKLTVPFCRELWQLLMSQTGTSRAQRSVVGRAAFTHVLWSLVQSRRFQAYEVEFMLRIFERTDRHCVGCADIPGLIATLLLLGSESEHLDKIALLFEVFDTDYDGCLAHAEILSLFCCICEHRPIVQDVAWVPETMTFHEELSAQEGLRAYEVAHWHLLRSGGAEGGVVTLKELLGSISRQPEVLERLMPGIVRIRWLLHARPRSRAENPADRQQLRMPSYRSSRWVQQLSRKPDCSDQSVRPSSQQGLLAIPRARTATPDFRGSEATKFKKTVTWKFQRSLRKFGNQRLTELTSGEGLRARLLDTPTQSPSHAALPAGRVVSSPASPARGHLLDRVHSSPALAATQAAVVKPSQTGLRAAPASPGGHRSCADLPAIDMPTVSPDKWGAEAADRFRLLCAITSSFRRCDGLNPQGTAGTAANRASENTY